MAVYVSNSLFGGLLHGERARGRVADNSTVNALKTVEMDEDKFKSLTWFCFLLILTSLANLFPNCSQILKT